MSAIIIISGLSYHNSKCNSTPEDNSEESPRGSNFKNKIDHFVDFGKIPESLGSSIINIEDNKVVLIREGDIKIKEILEVIQ